MMKKRTVKWVLLTLLVVGASYIAIHGPRVFATKVDEEISPKGYYRLEYFRPGFPYLFSMTTQYPRFVRLYDNRTGKMLGESDIVEMNGGNGAVFWPSKNISHIRVGVNIMFPIAPEPE